MRVISFHLMPWAEVEDEVAWPFSTDMFDPDPGAQLYQQYLDQLEYCEELGFDAIGFNEHHYTAYGLMPSPNLVASHMAARTDDIELAIMGNVLPIRDNPIRVAEELAMLDNISEGRIMSGFVRGIPTEYFAYGVDRDESRGRLKEAWDLIERAWTAEEPFDWDGDYWQYDDVYIWPRPHQDPHPPFWMPAESDESLRIAAEKQVPIGQVYHGTDVLNDIFDRYAELASTEFGWTPGPEHRWPCRTIYVAETMEQAREEAEEHVEHFYRVLLAGLYKAGAVQAVGDDEYDTENPEKYYEYLPPRGQKAVDFDFDELQESGEIVVGDPEYVTAELEQQYETLGGFGSLIGLFQFGTLPHELTMKNLELFADEVMPALRRLD